MLKKVFIAIHVLLIALVAFGLSGVSQATGIDRQFAITIDPLNPAPGSTHTYTLTITNDLLTGQKNQIQNIVVTVPSGFTLASTNPVIAPTGWSVAVSGNVVTLSTTNAFQLSPGQTLSIGINATAPNTSVTCPSSTTYTWAVAVSQQVDGGTGNDFALVFSSATVTVGSCSTPTNLVLNSVSPSGVETALDQQITFTATLTNALTTAPISGETVAFRLGGEVQCSAATNGAGVATCSFQYTHGSLPAGSYGVQATFAGDPIPNLTAANSNSINLTVSATGTSVVPSPAQGPYNGTVTLSATLTAIGAGVQGKTISFNLNGVAVGTATTDASGVATLLNVSLAGIPVGTYPEGIDAEFAGDTTYGAAGGTAALTVFQIPLSVTANNQTKVYGASDPTLDATYSGFVDGDTPANLGGTLTCSYSGTSVGTYPITCSGQSSSKYAITYHPGTMTITAAPLVASVTGTQTYGSSTPSFSASFAGFVNGDGPGVVTGTLSCTAGATATSPVGTYSITGCSGLSAANYTISYSFGNFSVTPATLSVTASSATINYGDPVPTINASYSGFAGTDNASSLTTAPTCTTTYTQGASAGSYPSTCSGGSSTNYTFTYVPGSVTVNQVTLNITASSATVNYNDPAPAITPSYSGFVGGDNASSLTTAPTCSTTYTQGSAAGSYPTTCSGAVSSNYTISYAAGSVTVNKLGLTITASNASVSYGDPVPAVTPSFSGFVGNDNASSLTTAPACSTTYTQGSPVGSYPTTCSGAASSNYTITYVAGSVTVGKASLTVTASSATVNFSAAVPTITPGFSGFVGADNASSLTAAPTCGTTYTQGASVGSYPTTCSGGSSTNYSFSYVPGTVTVNQATPTLSITGGTYTYDGQPHPASASFAPSACGTPTVTYSPVNSVPVSAGSYTASASFAGNANCTAASAGPASITINARQITVKANNTTIYVGQTPAFAYSIISGTVVGGDSLGTAVYTVNGSTTIPTSVGVYTPLAVTGLSNPNYAITTATGTFTILIRPTQLTYTGPTAGTDLGCGTTVSATLIDTVTNTGIPNVPVTITVGNQSITVNTDASGNATGSITLTQPVPAGQTVLNVTASAVYAGQTGLYSGSSDSKSFSIGGAVVVPGTTASTLYTGSRFFWTTSTTSSTATLTLSATIRDASPCSGNITKATVSFWISTDGNTWTPVSNGQNLPVGLVNPLDYSTGTASAISQYNLGKNPSAQLYVRVTVGGEYSFTGSTFDVPITVAIPGQARTLLAGGTLTNYGDSIAGGTGFLASGYLGAGDGVTSGANAPGAVDFGGQVTYNNKGTNPQGQLTVTIHTHNKPDGSSDTAAHSYWVKSNSISEMTLSPDGSTASFSAKSNVYDITGAKAGLDGGGVMQFTFTKAGGIYTVPTSSGTTTYTCTNPEGCASVVVFRSTGGMWFSSGWGTVGSLPQTIEKNVSSGTTYAK